jgi:hypothetical protein
LGVTTAQPEFVMSSLFISYSSKDRQFVRRLRRELFDKGVRIWIDESEIKVGDSLIEKIAGGIADVEFLGAVLSRNSIASSWVREELQIAITREINGKKLKVLPIVIDDCDLPVFLQHKKYADFRPSADFEAGVTQLLDVILAGHPMHLFMFGDAGTPTPHAVGVHEEKLTVDLRGCAVCHACRFHRFERDPQSEDTTGIMFSGTHSEKRSFLEDIWYNQLCSHEAARSESIDYATGKVTVEYKHCRDLNPDGKCVYYVPK